MEPAIGPITASIPFQLEAHETGDNSLWQVAKPYHQIT
jgi:hypothetical protein